MNAKPQQGYTMTIVRGCLALVGIAIFSGTLFCAAGAQEKSQTSKSTVVTATQVPAESTPPSDGPDVLQRRNPRYELSKGDIFDLNFPFTPEFNQTVTVHPDGFITLTGVGDLFVAGKTVPQLRELLQADYAKILRDPVINVVLKDFEKPYFIAGGDVSHPGKYELRDDTTLVQAIAIAGGFTENSKHSQVLLFHRVSHDWDDVKVLNVKKMFQDRNLSEDLHLQPGDMFFVPQNTISKIRKWIPYTSVSTGINPPVF